MRKPVSLAGEQRCGMIGTEVLRMLSHKSDVRAFDDIHPNIFFILHHSKGNDNIDNKDDKGS